MDTQLVALKFETGAAPYIAGDVAGFSSEDAQRYIDAKVARLMQPGELAAVKKAAAKAALAADELVPVRFIVSQPPYRVGEVAGFSVAAAAALVAASKAEEIDPSEIPEPPASERPAPLRRDAKGGAYIAPPDLTATAVVFARSAHGYMAGERAGFDEDTAAALIKSGVALDPKAEAAKEAAARRALLDQETDALKREQLEGERLAAERKAAEDRAQQAAGGDPLASTVDPNVEVSGLDDRNPEWRENQAKEGTDQPAPAPAPEKALDGPPADKMERGSGKKGRG